MGCSVEVGEPQTFDDVEETVAAEEGDEEIAVTHQELAPNFPLGLLAVDGRCPADTEVISLYLDAEDDGKTLISAWADRASAGADMTNHGGGGISFKFCKVSGDVFKPLTTSFTDIGNHYALLRLGDACPKNSIPRHFTLSTEYEDNNNSVSGNFYPNVLNGAGRATELYFCLFQSAPAGETMSSFPKFKDAKGVATQYSVFHNWEGDQPAWVLAKRYIQFDADNHRNYTEHDDKPPPPILNFMPYAVMQSIFEPFGNNDVYIEYARVR